MATKDWFLNMSARGSRSAIEAYGSNNEWFTLTWTEYKNKIDAVASALIEMGLKPADRVSVFSATRWEWAVTDLACLSSQKLVVPVYPNLTDDELIYIFNHSKPRLVFAENVTFGNLINRLRPKCPSIETVIVFSDEKKMNANMISFSEFLELGQKALTKNSQNLRQLLNETRPSTSATVLYTSGTTGVPKGVLLNHEQLTSEIEDSFSYVGVTEKDVSLTFLPYSHVLGRVEMWGHAFIGFKMVFARSIETVRSDLKLVKPTIMVAVPRIFEKVYAAIQTQVETSPIKKRLFDWATKIGLKVTDYHMKGEVIPFSLVPQILLAQKLVLNNVRMAFGGRLRFAISGGAPMNQDIEKFFHACGVLILEGYGLTETTGAIAVNAPFDYSFGFVGKPIGDTQIKIAEDGEILIKGKKVMKEYYLDKGATEAAMEDGWFKTGDIGELSSHGLKITDRKKDLIKTSGGKYVAPQKLEGMLKLHPIISHAHIHGDQKKYVVALLTLNPEMAKKMSGQSAVESAVREAVSQVNSELASYESIKKYSILSDDFTVESGELTPSLKVKRKIVDVKFRTQIEALY